MTMRTLALEEVAQHKTASSCWVIINSIVYDVTSFLPEHPGGRKSILRLAGKDATSDFESIHPPGTLEESLPESAKMGTVSLSAASESKEATSTTSEPAVAAAAPKLSPETLDDMINIADIEDHARRTLSKKAWAYYASGSDDSYTKAHNAEVFKLITFRPRILVDIAVTDTSSSILGVKTDLPIFVSPAALARLAHPDGEKAIARAAGKQGIVQMISNNASLRYTDIVTARVSPDQPFMFQLYVQKDRTKSEKLLKDVVNAGCKAVILTVDAPYPSKRELDERTARAEARESGEVEDEAPLSATSGMGKGTDGAGVGKSVSAGIAEDLEWPVLFWLRAQLPADVKIVLKGLQSVEDVVKATQMLDSAGNKLVDGVILSNHGGRSLNHAPPALLVLEELRLYAPEVFRKLEVYIDGGITRGTDVIKALCLGATQVGIGRPALYGLAGGFGESGVAKAIQILRDEVQTAMKLLGVVSLSQLGPEYVNTRQLDAVIGPSPQEAAKAGLILRSKL